MTELPFQISPGGFIAPAVDWLNTHFHPVFAVISTLIEALLTGVESVLLALPPFVLVAIVALFAWWVANWRISLLAIACLCFCMAAGLWTGSMQTIALVSVSVLVSVAIAFPLGILASRNKRLEATLRPVLDVMQTLPPWVYLVPAVIIFSLGRVPAIIATIVYGIPPMLRLTTLALNQVTKQLVELGNALGASRQSILWKIELPSAKPTILVGLNQCILLSLAMVVLAGLVGARRQDGSVVGVAQRSLSRLPASESAIASVLAPRP